MLREEPLSTGFMFGSKSKRGKPVRKLIQESDFVLYEILLLPQISHCQISNIIKIYNFSLIRFPTLKKNFVWLTTNIICFLTLFNRLFKKQNKVIHPSI